MLLSLLNTEQAIEKWFECHERVFISSNFAGVEVQSDSDHNVLSEIAYINIKVKDTAVSLRYTKRDVHFELTEGKKS